MQNHSRTYIPRTLMTPLLRLSKSGLPPVCGAPQVTTLACPWTSPDVLVNISFGSAVEQLIGYIRSYVFIYIYLSTWHDDVVLSRDQRDGHPCWTISAQSGESSIIWIPLMGDICKRICSRNSSWNILTSLSQDMKAGMNAKQIWQCQCQQSTLG